MNKLVILLGLCVLLAVLKAAVIALVLALSLGLLLCFVALPSETLAFLGTLGLLSLATAQPMACIITLGVVALAIVVDGARRESKRPPLLADRREER